MTSVTDKSGLQEELRTKDQLISIFTKAFKPREAWRVGAEYETFLATPQGEPVSYKDHIVPLFEAFKNFGWQPIVDGESFWSGLSRAGSVISIEPGLQLELATAPHFSVHAIAREVDEHLTHLKTVPLRIVLAGFAPSWSLEKIPPVLPRSRYQIMMQYFHDTQNAGAGLDMMLRTAGVQVSLDYADEADMVAKMRVATALQPVVTALFANSPFCEGEPNAFLSYRSVVWQRFEHVRSGLLPFVFDASFGIERYIDYALDVPLMFIYREGHHIPLSNTTFRAFLQQTNITPTRYDFELHLTTLFPEVRLKNIIEMRGADTASPRHVAALAALWVGLLYDEQALDYATNMIQNWPIEAIMQLQKDVPRQALRARMCGQSVQEIAHRMLTQAHEGLQRRQLGEEPYLEPLLQTLEKGKTPAEEALEAWQAGKNINELFGPDGY